MDGTRDAAEASDAVIEGTTTRVALRWQSGQVSICKELWASQWNGWFAPKSFPAVLVSNSLSVVPVAVW